MIAPRSTFELYLVNFDILLFCISIKVSLIKSDNLPNILNRKINSFSVNLLSGFSKSLNIYNLNDDIL